MELFLQMMLYILGVLFIFCVTPIVAIVVALEIQALIEWFRNKRYKK